MLQTKMYVLNHLGCLVQGGYLNKSNQYYFSEQKKRED